ncbi:MAG: YjbQ family protein [Candidatus Methanomethylophilaceae archaeon]|nr:YjbQ family protein [Candidatus Methanomethylophilaceae archaeon]MBQ8644022.1 YjbQ family protein [Candidatus Methanomethylophilaceae archaeon]
MSGYSTIEVDTGRMCMTDITSQVRRIVKDSGVTDGICVVFSKHTTAGITINENADPDVQTDMLHGLDMAFPDRPEFRHMEGNSYAHLRTSCVGPSTSVIVSDGDLVLGTWQGIYLCEFDGPRHRKVLVKVIEG